MDDAPYTANGNIAQDERRSFLPFFCLRRPRLFCDSYRRQSRIRGREKQSSLVKTAPPPAGPVCSRASAIPRRIAPARASALRPLAPNSAVRNDRRFACRLTARREFAHRGVAIPREKPYMRFSGTPDLPPLKTPRADAAPKDIEFRRPARPRRRARDPARHGHHAVALYLADGPDRPEISRLRRLRA